MTAFEQWVCEMVKIAVGEMRQSCEPDWSDTCARNSEERDRYYQSYHDDWTKTEQRIAILLVQARALECRHLAGEVAMKAPGHPIARSCWDRSHKLEAIGMMLANQWPIPDERVEPRNRICICGHRSFDHYQNGCEVNGCPCEEFTEQAAEVIEMPKPAEGSSCNTNE